MDRRGFLIGGAALASLAGAAQAAADDIEARRRAKRWVYGLPIIEMARLRAAAVGDAAGARHARLQRLRPQPRAVRPPPTAR